jgi:hypothetical protein
MSGAPLHGAPLIIIAVVDCVWTDFPGHDTLPLKFVILREGEAVYLLRAEVQREGAVGVVVEEDFQRVPAPLRRPRTARVSIHASLIEQGEPLSGSLCFCFQRQDPYTASAALESREKLKNIFVSKIALHFLR